ncbi:MAG TPA: alpha/beta fold hydrolase [Pyrinomonadaceae bacterium]|nr:alpha/beta fold hydrolase [Pyrinomonadaceae bacterium]
MTSQNSLKPDALLGHAGELFLSKPFRPHPLFTTGHAQTLAAYAWPRRHLYRAHDEARLFQVAPEAKVLAHCRWQPDRQRHPTVVLWHGIEGSSSSVYMLAMATKAFSVGFNVIRMNLRNCGGTEHLTPTLYHGGMTEDLRTVVEELISEDRLKGLVLVGFSLSGNMVLKLAGEFGQDAPEEVKAIVAVSPSVDLSASADAICLRSNWLYHRDFVRRLRARIRLKAKMYPGLYDTNKLELVRTIREFDDHYTAVASGFSGVDDYYFQASSIRVADLISLPTLIIHAEDDPFIPFAPLRHPSVLNNPHILLIATGRGGHVAFVSASAANGAAPVEDRFWAENRVIDFCRLATEVPLLSVDLLNQT